MDRCIRSRASIERLVDRMTDFLLDQFETKQATEFLRPFTTVSPALTNDLFALVPKLLAVWLLKLPGPSESSLQESGAKRRRRITRRHQEG